MDTQTERINVASSAPAGVGGDGDAPASADDLARSAAPAGIGHRLRWWRDALRRRMLAAADLVAAAVATILVTGGSAAGVVLLIGLPVWILVAKMLGLYDRDHIALRHLTADEIPTLLAWMTIGVGALALVAPVVSTASVTAGSALRALLCGAASAILLRAIARAVWRRAVPPESTRVIGDRDLAHAVARKIQLFPDMHLRVISGEPIEVVSNGSGDLRSLQRLLQGADRVIVAAREISHDPIAELAAVCRDHQVKLSVVSPLRGTTGPMPYLSQVADLPVLEFDTSDVSRSTALLKRGFDVLFSAASLAVLAPFFPLVALAIRLDSPGPAIFGQLRAGLDGRPFKMYKLRSMRLGAADQLGDLVDIDSLPEPAFKLRDDPRVTRVGRVLRRLSLDELPQLWNVLRGDMSIVGPRPEELALVDRYRPEHRFRLQVKPGMTGPMQVFGRGELGFSERLAVELDYVERMSLARDIWILLQTFPALFRGTGAY
jgi:exopolysaccharide biosynthesis polyprenyl glycosylphosphotransferase